MTFQEYIDIWWGSFESYRWSHLIFYAAALALVVFYRRRLAERHPRPRNVVNAIGVILVLRLVFADNPFAYYAYSGLLRAPEDVGWLTQTLTFTRAHKYYYDADEVDNLVLGSSQTYAVYQRATPEWAHIIYFAGMQPAEYPFMTPVIEQYNPRRILLYVSAFDLGRPVQTEKLHMLPGRWWDLPDVWSLYARYDQEHPWPMLRCAAAWTLVEYQHRETFRGLRNRLLGTHEAFHRFDDLLSKRDRDARATRYWEVHRDSLKGTSDEHLDGHIESIARLAAQHPGREIIVLEGHYHPRLFKNQLALHERGMQRIAQLAEQTENLRYIPHEALYTFTADDYSDGYHVSAEASERFSRHLFTRVLE